MAAIGLLLTLLGLWIMNFARKTEGISGAVFFLIGLALMLMGLYMLFFETGAGAASWMPWLAR